MREYIATYITGFGQETQALLQQELPHVRLLHCLDGLIHFRCDADPAALKKLPCLNNVFFVMKVFRDGEGFQQMVEGCSHGALSPLIRKGTFRVRFSEANRFVGVPAAVMNRAEQLIEGRSSLTVDRVNPRTEIWYIRRTEGVGFLAQLLWKRRITEKDLPKGQLRPEFAWLMCHTIPLKEGMTVCDPFAGYGGLTATLESLHCQVLASDLDEERAAALHGICADARHLDHIADGSVQAVITDPPWGLYAELTDPQAFYREVLKEMNRILNPQGKVVLLTACKQELEAAAHDAGFIVQRRIDTLVNGKKAAVFIMGKEKR